MAINEVQEAKTIYRFDFLLHYLNRSRRDVSQNQVD